MQFQESNTLQEKLMQLWDFTADDLAMNQAGHVSSRQLQQADQWKQQAPLAAIAFGIFWLVIAIVLNNLVPGAFLIMVLISIVIFGVGYWWYRKFNESLQNPEVKQLTGLIHVKKKSSRTGSRRSKNTAASGVQTSYSLTIDGVSFAIPRAVYVDLKDVKDFAEAPYRLYYLDLRLTRQILSIEPLPIDKHERQPALSHQ